MRYLGVLGGKAIPKPPWLGNNCSPLRYAKTRLCFGDSPPKRLGKAAELSAWLGGLGGTSGRRSGIGALSGVTLDGAGSPPKDQRLVAVAARLLLFADLRAMRTGPQRVPTREGGTSTSVHTSS